MLRSLAAAIPDDGSLTFFGDIAQQIYGHRMSWRSAGLDAPRMWKFKENYRNTKQIAQLALALADLPAFSDDPDLVEPTAPTADGPLPSLVELSHESAEQAFAVSRAVKLAETGSVAILFRTRDQEGTIPRDLRDRATRLHGDLDQWPSGPGLFYGTYHAAKGLEFDTVFLPFLSEERWPHPPDVPTFGRSGSCCARFPSPLRRDHASQIDFGDDIQWASDTAPAERWGAVSAMSGTTGSIRGSAARRGITRLCHFTPSRNLGHIAAGLQGILASRHLGDDEKATFNPTDLERLDGYPDHVCCSIQYPNAWYFRTARGQEPLFQEWVVLLIDPFYLWRTGTKFSPRNAAAMHGRLVGEGVHAFEALFAETVQGAGGSHVRARFKSSPLPAYR